MNAQPRDSNDANVARTCAKAASRSFWTTDAVIFQLLLAFRIVNALSINTFFQPDEYYQALEPAWRLAFGEESAAWITWEWRQHLRSAIHPTLFAAAYKLADIVPSVLTLQSSTRAEVLLVAPKLLQASLATIADYQTWRLARIVYGDDSAPTFAILGLIVVNPWQWFVSTRMFSNGLETTLTISALRYWPWEWLISSSKRGEAKRQSANGLGLSGLRTALLCAATATVLRPTNILIWVTVAAYTALQTSRIGDDAHPASSESPSSPAHGSGILNWTKTLILLREAVSCGSVILFLSVLVDRVFYGEWVFPPYNFLHFNVFQSLALFYGNNNWHYYLSEGFTLLLTTSIPYAAVGMAHVLARSPLFKTLPEQTQAILRCLSYTCITLPAALSLLSHKEVRFIYPILPSIQIITALIASDLKLAFTTRTISAGHIRQSRIRKRVLLLILIPLTVLISWYTTRIHNSGLINVTAFLRHDFETHHQLQPHQPSIRTGKNMTIAVLMPCHSLPWRSHLHHPPSSSPSNPAQPAIYAWALTCEPPLHLTTPSQKQAYKDEADVFYDNPRLWLRTNMARKLPTPSPLTGRKQSTQSGVHVNEKAQPQRNKQLYDGRHSHSSSSSPWDGIDITDLLPHLATSPPSTSQTNRTTSSTIGLLPSPSPPPRRPWPTHIVFFSTLEATLAHTLNSYGPDAAGVYRECWRGFNSLWHDDRRRRGSVVVWCLDFGDWTRDQSSMRGEK